MFDTSEHTTHHISDYPITSLGSLRKRHIIANRLKSYNDESPLRLRNLPIDSFHPMLQKLTL